MMKKYFLLPLLIALIPNVVFGGSARYSKLLHEKQRKMEQLEKCMGASKGLQVAGVSTLGLTAVGVAGNIWEAQTIKDNESTKKRNEKELNSLDAKLQKKKDEKAAKEAEQQQVKTDTQISEINNFKTPEDLDIFIDTLSLGDVTIGSSLSIPTDLLSTEGVSEKINNWKDLCDAVCHEEGALCATEKVDEKQVGENTVYTCLIDTCKEEGIKFKKSEDGLKCEPIEEESTNVNFVSATAQLVDKRGAEETLHIKTPEGMVVKPETPTEFSRDITYIQQKGIVIEKPALKIKPIEIDEIRKEPEA